MRRLDERGLAHAARAPEQGVVGGKPLGKTLGILDQDVARQFDALEEPDLHPVDLRHRLKSRRRGMPDEGLVATYIGGLGFRGRHALQRLGDAG